MDRDPLHDALVAIFEAIAEREEKPVAEVVAEFMAGYADALGHESASRTSEVYGHRTEVEHGG